MFLGARDRLGAAGAGASPLVERTQIAGLSFIAKGLTGV
jgi:hypothetical protein